MVIKEGFARHQTRRESGIATISLLIGPPSLAQFLWQHWLQRRQSVVELAASTPYKTLTLWLQRFFAEAEPWDVFYRRLADYWEISGNVQRYLMELPLTHRQLTIDKVCAALTQNQRSSEACRCLLRHLAGITQAPEPATIFLPPADTPLTGVALERIAGLADLVENRLPALFLHSPPAPEAGFEPLFWLAALAETIPRLPIALAISDEEIFQHYRRATPACHAKAVLTECPLHVQAATQTTLQSRLAHFYPTEKLSAELPLTEEILKVLQETQATLTQARQQPAVTAVQDQARSQAEAFLYEMLELCPDTSGLFQLNLKIPEKDWHNGQMENDLLCISLKIAIEVDGYYHFMNNSAYKRDRRKDFLLQAQGYFVLRFHAEDVVSDLPENLNRIIRVVKLRRSVLSLD